MPDFAPILTKVEFFKTSYTKTSAKVPPRSFSSLTLRLRGKVLVFTTEGRIESSENMLTFIPAGCAYETEIVKAGEMLIMHFWTAEGNARFCDHPFSLSPTHTENFLNLFLRGIRHAQAEETAYNVLADAYRLLAETNAAFFQKAPLPNTRMQACKQYLDAHVCDAELRISELAARYGSSEVYFRNTFKKYYNTTPLDYIKQRRMEIACQLLRTKLYTVAEVATRAGFDSISYFSSEFRRMTGSSPSEYRDFE